MPQASPSGSITIGPVRADRVPPEAALYHRIAEVCSLKIRLSKVHPIHESAFEVREPQIGIHEVHPMGERLVSTCGGKVSSYEIRSQEPGLDEVVTPKVGPAEIGVVKPHTPKRVSAVLWLGAGEVAAGAVHL